RRIKQILSDYKEIGACEGVGVAVPGMVDPGGGHVLHAPTLGWRDVNLRDPLSVAPGIPVNGEVLRGRHNTAGEFGHVPLSIDGPKCSCGATGCWEAYISNLATLSRYFGHDLSEPRPRVTETASFSVEDLIARARAGDA